MCSNILAKLQQDFNKIKDSSRRAIIQRELDRLSLEYNEKIIFCNEMTDIENQFSIMEKMRQLQLFGGVFQLQGVVSASADSHSMLTDIYYENDPYWKQKFEDCQKQGRSLNQRKKGCITPLDYQAFLIEQYVTLDIPQGDMKLVAFDAAYSIINMLENKVIYRDEFDLQKKLFDFLHQKYPSYSLELIANMTKINFIFYLMMRS